MKELVEAITSWRKIGAALSLVVALMTGFIIFLPDGVIERAGLAIVKQQTLPYLGILLFAAVAILSALFLEASGRGIRTWLQRMLAERRWVKTLTALTPAEKLFLRQFIHEQEPSVYAELSEGVASTLNMRKIIVRTASISDHGGAFPFALQPWARKALTANPTLLD